MYGYTCTPPDRHAELPTKPTDLSGAVDGMEEDLHQGNLRMGAHSRTRGRGAIGGTIGRYDNSDLDVRLEKNMDCDRDWRLMRLLKSMQQKCEDTWSLVETMCIRRPLHSTPRKGIPSQLTLEL